MTLPAGDRPTGPSDAERRFGSRLATARWRWWARRVLEALVAAAALVAVTAGTGIAYMAWARFDAEAVSAARTAVYLGTVSILLILVLPRLLRRLSRSATARYIEARTGGLDALVVSAAEVVERSRDSGRTVRPGSLDHALLERAAKACDESPAVRRLELGRMRRAGIGIAAVVLACGGLALWGSAPIQHGIALLLVPSADPTAGSPYRLVAGPGDVAVVAGEDQAVSALAEGFRPETVELLTRAPGESRWTVTAMTPVPDAGRHEALLFDLEAPREYYVRSGSVESARHRIEVIQRPWVSRIDLRYEYPRRTGRAPELIRDGGPIEAVRGTRVGIRITPDRPVSTGELVVDGERRIPLEPVDGELRTTLELSRDGRYRIELPAGRAGPVPASAEHAIRVHEDRLPDVALEWPGRDARVSPIEEIGIAVRAEDDVAVRDLELVLNVNGAGDRAVRLDPDPRNPAVAGGTHVLSLEELDLAPGDLISYYARASDAADAPQRVVTTDLYFLEVRPFEHRFRRAQAGGGGGGQGQGQGEAELTAQQRSLVVALFKLQRDRHALEQSRLRERIGTLEEAQARIRDRVDAIARRVGPRSFVSDNESYRRVAEELPRASRAMVETESRLAVRDLDAALPGARQALLHLQRADAAFRDVQVAMQRGGGGQQSGSQSELANLFRLEMDKFRNPYEELQRGRWNAPEQALDDALDKLRELARRQQREIERARLRAPGNSEGENSQQALAQEIEELRRELERLTRHRDRSRAEQARRSTERLDEARRAMERAGGGGDTQAGREALERLRAAQRDLEGAGRQGLTEGVRGARQRAEEATAEQQDIGRRLDDELAGDGGDPRRLDELAERKRRLADELRRLTADVERLRQRAHRERPEAAGQLEAAERALRERQLEQRLRRDARALERDPESYAADEGRMDRDLEAVRQRLARAGSMVAEPQQQAPDSEQTLERLRALVRGLKADQQRLADAVNRGGRPPPQTGNAGDGGADSAGAGGGSATGPAGSAGGPDHGHGADASGLRRQLLDRIDELEALGEDIPGSGRAARDVEALIAALRNLDGDAGTAELQELRRRQAELLTRMQRLEAGLRDGSEEEAPMPAARPPVEIAPRYQALIERYYRSLSEEPAVR